MQKNTDLSAPDLYAAQGQRIFLISAICALLCFAAAIYLEQPLLYLLPFAFAFVALVIYNFRAIFYLLLIVLPVSVEAHIGPLGIDLPSEPVVMLLAACALIYLVRYRDELKRPAFLHPITFILFSLWCWSIFVTFFSTDVILSIKYILAKSWYLLGFFVLPILLIRKTSAFRTFFWCLFLPTFISVLVVLFRHALQGFSFDSIQHAVSPIFRNHVNYAVFITMLLPFIFLAKSWYPPHYVRHKVLKYAIFFFFAAIYFSYTRGAWLAALAMPAYLLVLRFKLTKYVLISLAAGAIAFTVYILHDNNYLKYAPDYEHTIYHDELSEHLSSTFEMEDMSTVERFYRWIAAVKMFHEHPLAGVGPNNFVSNYKKYTVTAYETYISDNEEKSTVHNYFLLLLTEQGLPAMLLFVSLIAMTLLCAQQAYTRATPEDKKCIAAVTLCIVAFLLNNTLSDLVEANKVGSLFLMCLGLLVNFQLKEIEPDPE